MTSALIWWLKKWTYKSDIFICSFLFGVFFTSPVTNAAAWTMYHRGEEKRSESVAEIFITVSISRALFAPCQSDGETIRNSGSGEVTRDNIKHLGVGYHRNLCRNSFPKLEPCLDLIVGQKRISATWIVLSKWFRAFWVGVAARNVQLHSAAAGRSQIENCQQVDQMGPRIGICSHNVC